MNDTIRVLEFLESGPKTKKQIEEMLSTPLTEDITLRVASSVFVAVVTSQTAGDTLLLDDMWTEEAGDMYYCRVGSYLFLTKEDSVFIIDSDGRLWYAMEAHVYSDEDGDDEDEEDEVGYGRVLEIEAMQFCTDDHVERTFSFRIYE